ncbi:amino acid adenylation domain-containing protein [Streptomyces mirabilis]|uniref:amino acid adenylation domain-containing protein n=1 Tax=Streptomyces mirabilis TaxID=68239 RepID=UPI002F90F32C
MPSGTRLHDSFVQHAMTSPDRVALSTDDTVVRYGELNAAADRIAACLVALGVRPGTLVGLCARRTPDALVAMIAILKAGGAYVPLDPDYPAERLGFLLEDTAVPLVVATATGREALAGLHPAVLVVEDGHAVAVPDGPVVPEAGPPAEPGPTDPVYVIHTSGSTGVPKGVVVEHRNVVRLFSQTAALFQLGPDDTWVLFHSLSFDFSVWEIWGALSHGGRLVLLPDNVVRAPQQLAQRLRTQRVSVFNQTPSAFQQFLGVAGAEALGDPLRLVVFGGERLEPQTLAPYLAHHGDRGARLVNMYGITETTVHCTYRPITVADLDDGGHSPIGVPLPDLRAHVLDPSGSPVADGTPGELCVAGAGVARGYLNRPELTAGRFVTRPPGLAEERIYRSGDRVVRQADGGLYYLGRLDAQLKVRGYRIEPDEIELCLTRLPQVARAVVTARDLGGGDVRLVAHLLPAEPGDDSALRVAAERHVRAALPRHLRPSTYRTVSEFPMTHQGKVDRDALGM